MATIKTTTTTKKKPVQPAGMGTLFEKSNFKWMLIGIGVLALGFILMAGGKSPNPDVFDKSKVYSTTRITIAPIVILIGLAIEIYAIFYKPEKLNVTE